MKLRNVALALAAVSMTAMPIAASAQQAEFLQLLIKMAVKIPQPVSSLLFWLLLPLSVVSLSLLMVVMVMNL